MRISILAAVAAAGLFPGLAVASGPVVRDGAITIPQVRIHAPRAANATPVGQARALPPAGTTWGAPADGAGMRYARDSYRPDRQPPLYGDEDDYRDAPYDYGYRDGPYGDTRAYGVDDYAMPDRFMRDRDGRLEYDRDYPYDDPYGNYGGYGGGYTVVETTTTTEPSVVRRTVYDKVGRRRVKRSHGARRTYPMSGRASKTCACR